MVTFLGSLVQSCCGEEHCKQISPACVGSACSDSAALGLPLLTACVLSQATLLRLQVALLGAGPGLHALLSRSGSGSRVLHKGTDSIGPAFCALPRSQQLRRPGAWKARSLLVGTASSRLPRPRRWVSWVAACAPGSGVPCVSSGELIAGCDPPGGYQPSRIPRNLG